jgi:hypothetical protein
MSLVRIAAIAGAGLLLGLAPAAAAPINPARPQTIGPRASVEQVYYRNRAAIPGAIIGGIVSGLIGGATVTTAAMAVVTTAAVAVDMSAAADAVAFTADAVALMSAVVMSAVAISAVVMPAVAMPADTAGVSPSDRVSSLVSP